MKDMEEREVSRSSNYIERSGGNVVSIVSKNMRRLVAITLAILLLINPIPGLPEMATYAQQEASTDEMTIMEALPVEPEIWGNIEPSDSSASEMLLPEEVEDADLPSPMFTNLSAEATQLQNPEFEDIQNGRPVGWSYVSGGVESSTEQVLSGDYSVKLDDASSSSSTALRSVKIPVTAGETYEASVFSYNLQGTSELYLEFWDEDGNYTHIYRQWNATLNQWGEILVSGVAPEGSVYASLRLYLHLANVGTAYYDNASFKHIITGPQPELLNGDLEQVEDGMPKHWNLAATSQLCTERVRSGSYSVRIDDPSDASGVTVRSHQIAVTPGQNYTSTVWSYNLQGVSELYLEFWDASNNYTAILTGANRTLNEWNQIRVTGEAPPGSAYATVRFYLHKANIGTAYFDDATFGVALPNPVMNLRNGSFESDVDGKPAYWTESIGSVELSDTQVHDGARSAEMYHDGSGAVPILHSNPVSVSSGVEYQASVYAYSSQGGAQLVLEYVDEYGAVLGSSSNQGSAANQWEAIVVSGEAPAGATAARLKLTMDQAGTVWYDHALFRQTASVTNNKSRTTYYTPAKVTAARDNVELYSWAQNTRDNVVNKAESYLSRGLDFLWESVSGPNLPRSYGVNQVLGSPITGRDIDRFGNYPYQADPLNEPWKIVDPSSGYKFPTNDFGAYYRSGLDEHGIFQPELADRSLLVNTLYPEKGPDWGVDDGFGWVDDNGNRYTFVAYYNHWFLWYGGSALIQDAVRTLRDAYLYTGEVKYARAGTILLDRIADVYPEMDVFMHDRTIYLNSHGGTGHGKVVGSIWETSLVKEFISAYDAFFPAMDDPEIPQYLEDKAIHHRLTNNKSTAAGVRRNIEDGLLKQIYPGVKTAKIRGNNGMHQSALAMAAVVYDTLPETKEWIDFIFQTGGYVSSPPSVTGGNILNLLMQDVDRDGAGNEAAPGYNLLWLSQLQLTADILEGYDLYPGADLYEHVKFRKMYSAFYPLLLSEKFTANIGDNSSTGNPNISSIRLNDMVKAFDKFGDPIFAQLAHFLNNNSADGLHMDIFTANPGSIAERIRSTVAEHGPLNLGSTNMTGFGFTALRDGQNVYESFGLSYGFPSMEIPYQNTEERFFENSGTIQLEANEPGAVIAFNFHVTKTDDYEINLLPFKAPSYGIYRISIDGQPLLDYDFYGSNTNQFEVIGRMVLSAGTHEIRFENLGKHPDSSNYKMGVRNLNLLDEQARALRDAAGNQGNTLRDFWMYYGRNTGHGHRDTLNLGVHAFGLDLAPDLGYPEFADSIDMHRAQWVINTISHNTVVVNKRKQSPQWIAQPQHFDDSGIVKLIDVEAPQVYPQTELYKRTTAMIRIDEANSYAIDFFRVKGGNDHHFSFHGAEGTATAEGLNMIVQPTGTYAGPDVEYGQRVDDVEGSGYMGSGFHYLTNVSRDTDPGDQFSIDWQVVDTWKALPEPADIHLRLTMLGPIDEVALADGVPPQNKPGNPETLRYLIAHRTGTNLDSLFTSVIEPYKDQRTIATIEPLVVKSDGAVVEGNDVRAVKVILANGRVDYIVNSLHPDVVYTIDDKLQFKGFIGVYSEQDGTNVYRYVHDGSFIAPLGETITDRPGALHGTVVDFTRSPSVANEIVVDLNPTEMALVGASTADLVGTTIYIDNDGVRNAAYTIVGATEVSPEQGRYRLDIGDTTLIRSFMNPNDFSLGYVYDIAVNAAFRIPLTQVVYPLETVASMDGPQHQGWLTDKVTVTLSVYGSGGDNVLTEYSFDEGLTWLPYTAPFQLDDSGTYLLQYRSTNETGYIEPTRSVTIQIDRLPPATLAHIEAAVGENGWFTSASNVTLEATDMHSGVVATKYALTVTESTYGQQGHDYIAYRGPFLLDEGIYELLMYSEDLVGNIESEQRVEVKIDRTAPSITWLINGNLVDLSPVEIEDHQIVILNVGESSSTLWDDTGRSSILLEALADDTLSGVWQQTVRVDGQIYAPGTMLDWAGQPGDHLITITVVDHAGHVAETNLIVRVTTSPASIQSLIAAYAASNDLGHALVAQLGNLISQAEKHYTEGRPKQAVHFVDTFIQHLNIRGQQKNISPEAKQVLTTDANVLRNLWASDL